MNTFLLINTTREVSVTRAHNIPLVKTVVFWKWFTSDGNTDSPGGMAIMETNGGQLESTEIGLREGTTFGNCSGQILSRDAGFDAVIFPLLLFPSQAKGYQNRV